jgi:hypothetical protein
MPLKFGSFWVKCCVGERTLTGFHQRPLRRITTPVILLGLWVCVERKECVCTRRSALQLFVHPPTVSVATKHPASRPLSI